MNNDILSVTYEGAVAVVAMNAPPLNLLNFDMLLALRQTFVQLSKNKDLRAIILTANGEKAFCAGADAKTFGDFAPGDNCAWGQSIMHLIECCPMPVIAAIHGYCLGGGIELSLACDIRIAADNIVMRFPESGLGMMPAWGGATRLPWLIGEGNAKLLMFTGEDLSGQQALDLGIVQKCVPKEQLMDTCMAIAQRIASRAPKSMTAIKNVIHTARKGFFGGSLLSEQENNNMVAATKDIKEGITALQEKRAPVFHNE